MRDVHAGHECQIMCVCVTFISEDYIYDDRLNNTKHNTLHANHSNEENTVGELKALSPLPHSFSGLNRTETHFYFWSVSYIPVPGDPHTILATSNCTSVDHKQT